MIEVKVTILLPGIPEALNRLADTISGSTVPVKAENVGTNAATIQTAAPIDAPTEAPAQVVNQTDVPEAKPSSIQSEPVQTAQAPVNQAPVASAVPAASVQPSPVEQKKITLHDLSIAGAKMVENGKMNDVIGLLKNFGVPAITSLAESQYESFAAGLRSLGANI